MARKYTSHSSSLFLLELILAILFFSIASAVCVQLFVKSHLFSKQAEILSIAVNECADVAEIIYSADTDAEMLERLAHAYPHSKTMDQQLHIPYDESYELIVSYDILSQSNGAGELQAEISFENTFDKEVVYELIITHQIDHSLLQEASHE